MQQNSSRASPSVYGERERCNRGEGGTKAVGSRCPPSPPPLYRPPKGVPALEMHLQRGAAAKGGSLPPKASGAPPALGFPTLGAGGRPGGAHQPTMGWFPPHFSPRGPPGWVAPPGGPPGPIWWSRYNTGDPQITPDGRNDTSCI